MESAESALKLHRVKSSHVAAIAYKAYARELIVAFKSSDDAYRYESVPQRIYNELINLHAGVGSYLHQHVIGKFSATKYEGKWEIVDD